MFELDAAGENAAGCFEDGGVLNKFCGTKAVGTLNDFGHTVQYENLSDEMYLVFSDTFMRLLGNGVTID